MDLILVIAFILSVFTGTYLQSICVLISLKGAFLSYPDLRRQHPVPTPLLGGAGIFLTFLAAQGFYLLSKPEWISIYGASLRTIDVCAGILLFLGLADDFHHISPLKKLLVQGLTGILCVTGVPELRQLCMAWDPVLGIFTWTFAVIWIVGISNGVNLIDGLDGLAAGSSMTILASIGVLSLITHQTNSLFHILVISLYPALMAFYQRNKNPAQIFMGNNGALPLGFLIAIIAALCQKPVPSLSTIASMFLFLGHPIFDMGLVTYYRIKTGAPIFKADRNHVHYRLAALGLSVSQTLTLILQSSLCLQIAGLSFFLMDSRNAGIVTLLALLGTGLSLQFTRFLESQKKVPRIRLLDTHSNSPIDNLTHLPRKAG